MANFAFSASYLIFYIIYFILAILCGIFWHYAWRKECERAARNGAKAPAHSWIAYFFYPGDKWCALMNWVTFLIFLFNVFRLICTIIFGFAPTG